MKYSVIIPVWNEEHNITDCVNSIRILNPEAEIIVADGHSTDGTLIIASANGVRTCLSQRGRGPQCNAGATIARGDILIFLHVDTKLPDNAFTLLEEAFKDPKTQFGVFKLAFDVRHWFLDTLPWLVRPNLPFIRFGDQCFVIRRSFFQSLGGFPELSLYEDVALARKASHYTRTRIFPSAVTTSARRFIQNGAIRQFFHDGVSLFRYFIGTNPEKLAGSYNNKNGHLSTGLIAMARQPEPGKVKTRLAKAVGAVTAAEVYRICAKIAFREMKGVHRSVKRYVFLAGDDRGGTSGQTNLHSPFFYYASQEGKDLGERLKHAFRTVFRHGANRAVAIATDVPDISSEIMEQAIDYLNRYDVVLGPSPDGGYYLIGIKQFHEEFFLDIDWGTDRVLMQALTIAERLGLSVGRLPELADIDNYNDLSRWMATKKTRHPLFRLLRYKLPPSDRSSVSVRPRLPDSEYDRCFSSLLEANELNPQPDKIETMWANITRRCNQACTHCHVEGSPERTEQMDRETMEACLAFLESNAECTCLDITGGAPELNPDFEYLVLQARKMEKRVVVRTNLTIFYDGDRIGSNSKTHLPEFYAANQLELIASLPHYDPEICDNVRGNGVHEKSLKAVEALNRLGYGKGEMVLNLMHNSEGPLSPSDRRVLEDLYRDKLSRRGLYFNKLYTVTNVPINRYRQLLEKRGNYTTYMESLKSTFSRASSENLACRSLFSVSPDGTVYDCDFNQALDLPVVENSRPLTIFTAQRQSLLNRRIRFGAQCFGCTAGGGSS